MMTKIVKEYSNRQRIDLNKGDGFSAGDEIILLTKSEYDNIQQVMQNMDTQIKILENENTMMNNYEMKLKKSLETKQKELDTQLEKMLEISLKPITKTHKEELDRKDNKLNQLSDELKTLREISSQFSTKISQLSTLDILFRKKHINLIDDFEKSIWINAEDKKIVDADVKQVTSKDD